MDLFELSGRTRLGVTGASPAQASAIARLMDPFAAAPGDGEPDVLLRFAAEPPEPALDVQNPARDGLTTAYDGRHLRVLAGEQWCSIGRPAPGRTTLDCSPGFPLGRLFRSVLRPALQASAVGHGAVAVHSAAVEIGGRAVLVAGWSESGKTETALAFMEQGAGWLSDKWTLVGADAEASAFPINVGVRRWVLPYLPRLAAGLPRAARLQVAAAGAAARATAPVRRRRGRGGVVGATGALAERAVALADRAALTPAEIRTAYGQKDDPARRLPLGTLALLSTVPGPGISVTPGDAARAAARLAATGAYERDDWHRLGDRERYAGPGSCWPDRAAAIDAERRILERALAGTRVLDVRAPFPVDPRRVAAAIEEAL